jgi:hypothetical protein
MKRLYHTNTAFLDLLFNSLIGFVGLFFLAYILVNPKSEEEKKLDSKAEFVIIVTWDKDFDDDVDSYVQDPEGHLVSFKRREDGLMHLDRDDLGHRNDVIETQFGEIKFEENREIVTIRGIIPGEYVVNVHMYKKVTNEPVTVKVQLDKINSYSVVVQKEVNLDVTGAEKTAFRFVIDKDGSVADINSLPKSLIEDAVVESEQP